MVREVEMAKDGRASGVIFIDKTTGKEQRVKGRIVVLAASACETVRILFNSKSAQFPQGLANSSGKVGKYLMDTVGASVTGQIPALEDMPPHNEDGAGGEHVYAPWWLYKEQKAGKLDFARGYHIEIGAGRDMPSFGATAGLANHVGGYGKKFKQDMRRYYGSFVSLVCRGEMIPNDDSYCEIDPQKKDQYGIPTLRFNWKWSEHEKRQALHSHKAFTEVIENMGGRVTSKQDLLPGGFIIHEVGGAIMGSDSQVVRRESVGPDLGREELVPHRRRALPFQRRQESDPDHHGARLAQRRLHAGRNEAAGAVTWRRSTTTIRCASIDARRSSGCWPLARLCNCLLAQR